MIQEEFDHINSEIQTMRYALRENDLYTASTALNDLKEYIDFRKGK